MTIDAGWVGAIAAIVTALIILGTAVAAFMQLRHGRNANDIVVYLRFTDFMDANTTLEVRAAMRRIAEQIDTDPAYADRLRVRTPSPKISGRSACCCARSNTCRCS